MNALHPEVLVLPEGREAQLLSNHLGGGGPLSPLTGPTGGRIQRSLYHHDPQPSSRSRRPLSVAPTPTPVASPFFLLPHSVPCHT